MALPLQVDSLRKKHDSLEALAGVSLRVEAGEILGVLGPNGAGKTTLVECALSLRRADAGRVTLLGETVSAKGLSLHQRNGLGVCLQTPMLPAQWSVSELLNTLGQTYTASRSVEPLLHDFGLHDRKGTRLSKLSGGQRQRAALAAALVGNPRLLVVDEPTSELDPQARRAAWDAVLGCRNEGGAVLLTTHQMEEAEQLCDRVVIMDHGRILAEGAPRELIAAHGPAVRRVHLSFDVALEPAAGAWFLEQLGAECVNESGGKRAVVNTFGVDGLRELLCAVHDRHITVRDVAIERHNLEDVFLQLTGRTIRS
jgi:ABC-2 type transport system ATP-binding protein